MTPSMIRSMAQHYREFKDDDAHAKELEALANTVERLYAHSDERTALRSALKDIVAISSDRQRFVMMGPRAFAAAEQIARDALATPTPSQTSGEQT